MDEWEAVDGVSRDLGAPPARKSPDGRQVVSSPVSGSSQLSGSGIDKAS